MVTSLSMVADLIGYTTVRSECVCLGRGEEEEEGEREMGGREGEE